MNSDIIKNTAHLMIYRADKKETKKGRHNSAQFAVTSTTTYPRDLDGFSNSSHCKYTGNGNSYFLLTCNNWCRRRNSSSLSYC